MKIQNFFHGVGAVTCIISMLLYMKEPGAQLSGLYWQFVALMWCLSSWLNAYLAHSPKQ